MKFCKNCRIATEQTDCPACGTKKLRDVTDDDFCFLAELQGGDGARLADLLEAHEIPYSAMPWGSGTESRLALPLSGYRIYVPYRSLKRAKDIIAEEDKRSTEEIKKRLLENADKLNILPAAEKNIRKKLDLSPRQDIFECCIQIIRQSDEITDAGLISGCANNGHYLFCRMNNLILALNSETYEILSVDKV